MTTTETSRSWSGTSGTPHQWRRGAHVKKLQRPLIRADRTAAPGPSRRPAAPRAPAGGYTLLPEVPSDCVCPLCNQVRESVAMSLCLTIDIIGYVCL